MTPQEVIIDVLRQLDKADIYWADERVADAVLAALLDHAPLMVLDQTTKQLVLPPGFTAPDGLAIEVRHSAVVDVEIPNDLVRSWNVPK